MSLKLKAIGLGLIAAMAMGALAVVNASATVSGHFTSDAADGHTFLIGSEGHNVKPEEIHTTEFSIDEGTPIRCTVATYSGTVDKATVTSVTIFPHYTECSTTNSAEHNAPVHVNGCHYTFESNSTSHGTVSVICPPEKTIVITHPNCTITVGAQAPSTEHMKKGVTYTTTTINGKHGLTVDVTVEDITAQYHGGICIFLGTNHTADMTGSVTLRGTNTNNEPVNVTAT